MEKITFLDADGHLQPGAPALHDEQLLKAFKAMLLTRRVDERMITLQRQGKISFALASLGEEACAVGAALALEPCDWIYPQYREAGAAFMRGMEVALYIDQMFGNSGDLALGRQMPNHFGTKALNIVHVSSPIATQIPHAAGCGYAMKLQKEPSVALCFFGEGATSEGDFHCGLNFAAVQRVPAIFFCRNNGYAISTPVERQMVSDGVAVKGVGYGVSSLRIDGNDLFAVYGAVQQARKRCLEGQGPLLIEAMTYRLGAHSSSDDPSRYRDPMEVAIWQQRCPIKRLQLYLAERGLLNDELLRQLHSSIDSQISSAIEQALSKQPPELSSLFDQVTFAKSPILQQQQLALESQQALEGDLPVEDGDKLSHG